MNLFLTAALKRWTALLAFAATMLYGPFVFAAAQPVYDFRLIQGWASLPNVSAYVDISGVNGSPVKSIDVETLKISLGGAPGRVKRISPFEDSGEGIAYVLLVDISKSLSADQFGQMKETLAAFVDSMSSADQAALITFGSEVKTIQGFSPDRSRIKEKLAALAPTDEDTAFYGAVTQGISVARAGSANVPRRRVIITLTDGVNDFTGGAGKDDIIKSLEQDPVTLYLIGFFQGKPGAAEEAAISVMKQFAQISGGRYYDGREGSWRGIYFAISRAIRNAFLIEAEVPDFRSEGRIYPLEITLSAANRTWTEKLQITTPAGGKAAPAKTSDSKPVAAEKTDFAPGQVAVSTGIAAAAALAVGIWFWRRRRSGKEPVSQEVCMPEPAPAATASAPAVAEAVVRAPEPGVLVRLTRIHEGPPPHQVELEIDSRVVIGSDPAVSHLVLESDNRISPAHCEIFFEAGFLYVRDLSGGQGTFLNGAAVAGRQRIEEQDVLRLGATELRITFPVEP